MSPQVVNLCRTDVREGAASLLLLPLTALASSNKKRITRSRKGRAKVGVLIITEGGTRSDTRFVTSFPESSTG